jgi:predicted nucleic acid-binding protein
MKGIADTGFLVGFVSRDDAYHDGAVRLAGELDEPLLACEAVLAEIACHLRNCSVVFEMLREGIVALAFDCNDHLAQLEALAKRYPDRRPDPADPCLIRMSEVFPKHPVVTLDLADFRVCRRNKREAIPLVCLPEYRRPG